MCSQPTGSLDTVVARLGRLGAMSDAGSSTDAPAAHTSAAVAAEHPGPLQEGAAAGTAAAQPAGPAVAGQPSGDGSDLTDDGEPLLQKIQRLKTEQAEIRKNRRQFTRDLRNAEKRRTRLRKRARQLSDADLRQVLQMRATPPEPPAAEAAPAAEPSAAAGAVAAADGGETS